VTLIIAGTTGPAGKGTVECFSNSLSENFGLNCVCMHLTTTTTTHKANKHRREI